jgi:hypothetical protein
MSRKVLHVVEGAYRGTLEEQDDTVLWLVQALRGAGASGEVLLRGNAVNYLVPGQDASGLAFGMKKQTHPPAIPADVVRMLAKGITLHFVTEDAEERGLEPSALIQGPNAVRRSTLPELFAAHDQVWHW